MRLPPLEHYFLSRTQVYKSNIPADRRPQAGQILLFSDVTEMFPTGFWGRVKNISETNDGFVIETETVTIEETFKNLNVNKNIKIYKGNNDIEVVLESEHSIGSRSSTVIEEIITIPLNGNFKTENWFANFQGNISLLMQLGFNIKIENHSISVFIIKPQIGLNTHIDDFSFGLYKELSNDLGFSNSIPIIQPVRRILSAMSIGPLVIVPELIGGLFASASGEVEITLPFKFDLGAELELNLLTGGFSVPKPTGGIDFSDVFTDKFNVKLKGGVGVGPGAGLGFIFYGLVPVEFIYSPQYAFSGELELYFNSPYNALKNSKTKFGNILNLEASIGSVFSQQLKKSISFSSGDAYMGIEKCFLPTISNMKLNASEVLNRAEQNEMISYNIDNESWLSHKHSLMILKDGKLIKTLSDNRFDNFVNDSQGVLYYELSEEGLAYGEKYKAKALITVPYFTGDRVYEADSIEFIYPENIKVTTGDVVDFSYNSASFGTNFISGINLNSEFKYGILCSWDNVPTVDNSVKVENNEIEDGSFTAFTTNLNPNIRYYYRAYVYK